MDTIKEIGSKMKVFEDLESEVRSYCRNFPTLFTKSKNYKLWDSQGNEYIDFFAGAGALNYGHNNPAMKEKLIEYITDDGICHSLDKGTEAKRNFLKSFNDIILKPRKLKYKVMFPGPTGTNAVESALKLARKVTGRDTIVSFTNGFHGMTLGALSVTGNAFKRKGAGIQLTGGYSLPFDKYFGKDIDTVEYLERYLEDDASGLALPAAIILETVQGEGGLNTASSEWLKKVEKLCRRKDILLIVDDIQAGCGRTGTFFSFEAAGIKPDIVCLSKSIGGYGLPMAITLIKPEIDIWEPGEHNGTFRGNNLAFVTATEALNYWKDNKFEKELEAKSKKLRKFLDKIVKTHPEIQGTVKGRGLFQGIACGVEGLAPKICANAFKQGLIMETAGANDEVFKIMPPLTIDDAGLEKGFAIIEKSVARSAKKLA